MKPLRLFIAACSIAAAFAQDLVPVIAKPVSRLIVLPGEFEPYMSVRLNAKISGYIERVLVDRGSVVKKGDLLAELSAPEMKTRITEAESKVQAAQAEQMQVEAQLASQQSVLARLKKASETPGAIAGTELVIAQRQVEALEASVRSKRQDGKTAEAGVKTLRDLEQYLRITAPFEGVVTDRLLHPGALAGPNEPLLVLQQVSRLRLIVAVPEEDVAGIVQGATVEFKVPAYTDRTYSGIVARTSRALDPKSRTMPVELNVVNADGTLAPGMYPSVKWPVKRAKPALYVPKTAVVTTTERVFVVREKDGKAEWVTVGKGAADGDLVEVTGPSLRAGDKIVKRATDEIRDGMPLKP